MKTKICAVALAMAVSSPTVMADDFTYISGGALFSQSGFAKKNRNSIEKNNILSDKEKAAHKLTKSGFGFYLNGSMGFNDYLFVEGRFHNSNLDQQSLLGIGAHYPVLQSMELYGLVGMVQKSILIGQQVDYTTNPSEPKKVKEACDFYKDTIQPTVEIGAKWRLNEAAGVRLSYRYAQFGKDSKLKVALGDTMLKSDKHLHAFHLGGAYQMVDNVSLEAGYNLTRFLKVKETTKSDIQEAFKGNTTDHQATVGVRYTF